MAGPWYLCGPRGTYRRTAGFAFAGIGGALLGAIVGGGIGLMLGSAVIGATLLITDSRNTLSLLLIAAALVGIPLFIFVFWGVGK